MTTISTRTINRLLSLAVLLTGLAYGQVSAQTQDARPRAQAPWLTTAVTPEQVRYLAPLNVYQLRLEIYDDAGNRLYDSGAHLGNLLDWTWQDQQGQHLNDGSYRYLITYKDFSGQTSQRAGRLRRQGAEAAFQEEERGAWLAATPGEAALAGLLVGHDGRDARLSSGRGDLSFRSGDFFAGQEVERMRLTAEGNLGLGIVRPQARLDVAGLIRTSEGIVFPDGTIQTTAARGASRSGGLGQTTDERGVGFNGNIGGLPQLTAGPEQSGFFSDIVMNAVNFGGNLNIADIRLSNNNGGLRFTATPGLTGSPNGAAIQFWGNNSAFPGNLFLDAGALDSAALIFRTATSNGQIGEKMRITASGNVGIGTTNPVARLHVENAVQPGVRIQVGDTGTVAADRLITFGDSRCSGSPDHCVYIGEQVEDDRMVLRAAEFRFRTGHVRPDSNGGQDLGSTINRWRDVFATNGMIQTSDRRLKQDISNLRYGLRDLMQLRPVTFQWKDRTDGRTYLGLLAQEVEAVIPEAVERAVDPAAPLGLNYSNLIPVLIKATQEQQTTLEQKEAEIKALKAENAALSTRLTALEQMMRQFREQLKAAAQPTEQK